MSGSEVIEYIVRKSRILKFVPKDFLFFFFFFVFVFVFLFHLSVLVLVTDRT